MTTMPMSFVRLPLAEDAQPQPLPLPLPLPMRWTTTRR